jgi:hypothetical protein
LFHIILENFLSNFFQSNKNLDLNLSSPLVFSTNIFFNYSPQNGLQIYQQNNSPSLNNPFVQLIRIHLSKSSRIKSEWKNKVSYEQAQKDSISKQQPNNKNSLLSVSSVSSSSSSIS